MKTVVRVLASKSPPKRKRVYKPVPCGLRRIDSIDYGTDYDCDYGGGMDCDACIINGGHIDPRTGKSAPKPLQKLMRKLARERYEHANSSTSKT